MGCNTAFTEYRLGLNPCLVVFVKIRQGTEFSIKIRHIRDTSGLSRRAFGELLGVPEGKIQKIEGGDQRADHEFLSTLGKSTGVDVNWLLNEEDKELRAQFPKAEEAKPASHPAPSPEGDFVHVPRYDVTVSAGNGSHPSDESVVGHYAFSRRWLTRRNLNPCNLAVVRVTGDSMEPKLTNNDLAVIDTKATDLKDGVTYVFRLGEDLLIKRLQILPNRHVNLCSHNPEYSPIQVDLTSGELASIGRVVASMHEW